MGRSGNKSSAGRIRALRQALRMSQQAFAERMQTFQTNVSKWESGEQIPSAETYLRLSELAVSPSDSLWFMQQAGLSRQKLLSIAGALLKEQMAAPLAGEIIRVPVLDEKGSPGASFIALPAHLIP